MVTIFILLVLFQFKHFLADYPLQTEYMLGKFKPGREYILPLLAHSSVHGALTLLICWIFGPLWLASALGLLDMGIHFAVDRLKASPKLFGRFKILAGEEFASATEKQKRENKYFWWALGFDQTVHHLTHYVIILALIGLN